MERVLRHRISDAVFLVGAALGFWILGRRKVAGHSSSFRLAWAASHIGEAAPARQPARQSSCHQAVRRKIGGASAGRVALLHALAHIELNAIDLAWDIIARFTHEELPRDFYDDWVQVADEEAKHFDLLSNRLSDLGAAYGDLPAHDGLWQAAEATADDLLARLAVVPMVLEARGLDVTPAMIEKLRGVEDNASADILRIIYEEEIGHVTIGRRWFQWLCERRGLEPLATWQALVRERFRGPLSHPSTKPAEMKRAFPRITTRPWLTVPTAEPAPREDCLKQVPPLAPPEREKRQRSRPSPAWAPHRSYSPSAWSPPFRGRR